MEIKVDNTDITEGVDPNSFRKRDNLYNKSDRLRFTYDPTDNVTKVPEAGDDVTVNHDSKKQFDGTILSVDSQQRTLDSLKYEVKAKSHEHEFDRRLVVERKTNTDVATVIDDLVNQYAPSFTTNSVDVNIDIETVKFNNLKMTECLDKLADLTGYTWFIDYDKDIHFFSQTDKTVEHTDKTVEHLVDDTSQNYYHSTLEIKEDFSQIRNVVKIRGGNYVANEQTHTVLGDGSQKEFPLPYKYDSEPTVKVDGTTQTVGPDNLETFDNNDVLWSFQQKYIRFENPPADGAVIEVTEKPLVPILIQATAPSSISKHGKYEYYKKDLNIESHDEAHKVAQAELNAYKETVKEAEFETKEDIFSSGDIVLIDSNLRNVNQKYVVQKVTTRMINPNTLRHDVKLATLRTIGLVELLQRNLFDEAVDEGVDETLLAFISLSDTMSVADNLSDPVTTSGPYGWDSGTEWGFGTWS